MIKTGFPLTVAVSTAFTLLVSIIAASNSVFTHAAYHHPHDVVHVVRFNRKDIMTPVTSRTKDGLKIYPFLTNRPNGSMAHLDTTLRSRVSPAFYTGEERPTLPPDYFLKAYTDDHLDPEVRIAVNDKNEIVRVEISFPPSNCLWMPSFTAKIMTVRAASEIPEKYYVTEAEQAGNDKNTDSDDIKDTAAELGKHNKENDELSNDQRQYRTILSETMVPMGDPEMKVALLRLTYPNPITDLLDDIVVFIHVHPRVVTSFVYELVTIPDFILKKGSKMYDLTPSNTTMNFKFLLKYDSFKDAIGIWVSRKLLIPNFSLLIAVDGDVVLNENVANPSPSPEGFPAAILHAKSKQKSTIRIVVHFYERPRDKNVCFLIPDYQKTIVKKLFAESDKDDDTGNPRSERPYLDYPIPHLSGFALRFTNDTYDKGLTVAVIQPYPISDLMLSMFVLFDKSMAPKGLLFPNTAALRDHHAAGEEERNGVGYEKPILIFRKEERHTIFIPPGQRTQFGWYNAAPTTGLDLARKTDASYVTVEGIDHVQLAVCVAFNKKDRINETHFEEMGHWIHDYGGDVSKVTTVLKNKENSGSGDYNSYGRHTKGGVGLVANRAIGRGEIIAGIPYKLLFTSTAAESNEWVKEVMKNTTKYNKRTEELHLDAPRIQHFMFMTFFMLLEFSSVLDGVDWHLYFNTIPFAGVESVNRLDFSQMDYPNVPVFYTQDELRMFSYFSPAIEHDIESLRELAKVEYETICEAVHWFHARISEEQYMIARAQVENRVYNLSGMMTMIPVVDHLFHDEHENVKMIFNDEEQMLEIIAKHPINPYSRLTMDYDTSAANKYNFFIQYGFIPSKASDVAVVKFYKRPESVFAFRQDRAVRLESDFEVFKRDEYVTIFLTKSDESIAQLFDVIRTDAEVAAMILEIQNPDPITEFDIRDIALKFLKKQLNDMPLVSKATKLPRNAKLLSTYGDKDRVIKQQTKRRKELEALARQLYDSHVSVLKHHIKKLSSDV